MLKLILLLVSLVHADEHVIGGQISNVNDWPQVVKIQPIGCTGTLIGPATLLTAAHCAKNAQQYFMLNGVRYDVVLKQHPKYGGTIFGGGNFNYDISVGLIQKSVPYTDFGRIGKDLKVGQDVRMAGFGCDVINGNGYGILREGVATVKSIGTGDFATNGPANVCYGDSGGALWDAKSLPAKIIVGIVSRTDGYGTASFFTRVNYAANYDFIRKFADDNETPVCDVNVCCL